MLYKRNDQTDCSRSYPNEYVEYQTTKTIKKMKNTTMIIKGMKFQRCHMLKKKVLRKNIKNSVFQHRCQNSKL